VTDGPATTGDTTDPVVGRTLSGRYRVIARLGEGGIGTVYRAHDETLRSDVAVKVLRPELAADAEVLARFGREAKTMLALSHENIVQALNFGRAPEGDLLLVMELARGQTLRSVLVERGALPLALGTELFRQLGAALERAHSMGVVHRDLKPENIVVQLDDDGGVRAKVLDFGMARIVSSAFGPNSVLTKKGAIFGTPQYMAPEQCMGQPADARADQYALGVMLFEMLAGKRPFSAPTPIDMLQMQIHKAPPALRDVGVDVSDRRSDVVLRMMAKKPDERFHEVSAAMAAWNVVDTPVRKWWDFFRSSRPPSKDKR